MAVEGNFGKVQGADWIQVNDEWFLCRPGSKKVVMNKILEITPLTILLEDEGVDLSQFGIEIPIEPAATRFRRQDIDWLELIARP